jgi:hypothetical protein
MPHHHDELYLDSQTSNGHLYFISSSAMSIQGVIGATHVDPLTITNAKNQIVKLRFTRMLSAFKFKSEKFTRFIVLRASDLPDGRRKYFIALKTSAGWADDTDWKKGKNPEWNKEFVWWVSLTRPSAPLPTLPNLSQ